MGLLRTLLILAIIYVVFRFFAKYIFPTLLSNFINKKMSEMQHNRESYMKSRKRREGEITIDVSPDKEKRYPGNTGEYVDFEEIK